MQHHEDDAQPVADKPAGADATQVADAQACDPQGDAAKPGDGEQKQPAAATGQPVAEQPAADSASGPTALLAAVSTQAQPEKGAGVAATAESAAKPAPASQPASAQPAAPPAAAQQTVVTDAQAASVAAGAADAQVKGDAGAIAAKASDAQAAAPVASRDVPAAADRPAAQAPVANAEPRPASNGATQQQGQQQAQQQAGQEQPQPADQARTVAQAYGRNDQTHQAQTEVPTAQTSGVPAASPVTQVAGGQPAAARGGVPQATPVPLSRAAENVEHVLRLASTRGGFTHARIELHPASLGSVDVHLRQTADGLMATVTAHSPEAVQQLQQAAGELRRQLEDQGVNLAGLDIGQSAGDERSAGRAGAELGEDGQPSAGGRGDSDDANGAEAEVTTNSTLRLPNGVLVDVLA